MHCTLPWIRDQPHDGEFVGGGRERHRELLAWAAFEGPREVGAENKDRIPTSQDDYVLQGHPTGCRFGNGEKLSSSQAEPGQAIESVVAYFPSISCETSCRVALYTLVDKDKMKWQLHLCLSQQVRLSTSVSANPFSLKGIAVVHGNPLDACGNCKEDFLLLVGRYIVW